jgi:hypothetical protein
MQEYISAAVDQHLDRAVQAEFIEHIRHCVRCSSEYDLERATKRMIQSRIQFVETPVNVRAAILGRLQAESRVSIPRTQRWEDAIKSVLDIFTVRHLMPAVGMVMIVMIIVGVALVVRPFGSGNTNSSIGGIAEQEGEVLHQALDNFHDVKAGKIGIQLASAEPSTVKAFFQDKVSFNVDVHKLNRAELVGAVYSEYKGAKLAHIIYKYGNKIIYVYQASMKDLGGKSGLCARHEIQDALAKSDIFMDSITSSPHNCTTVIWEERGILCSAISTLPRNEMLTILQDQIDPDKR